MAHPLIRDLLELAWGSDKVLADFLSEMEQCDKVADAESKTHDGSHPMLHLGS